MRASAEQIGEAARMRGNTHGRERKQLNFIVHSPNPEKRYGENIFAKTANYDPHITDELRAIALRNGMPTDNIDLIDTVHALRELLCLIKNHGCTMTTALPRIAEILEKMI
jgi:hypothetical protein